MKKIKNLWNSIINFKINVLKKFLFFFAASLIFLSSCSQAFAQSKFGYIDSSELLSIMPEKKTAEGELQTFANSLESQLGAMQSEYQASVQDYQSNEATYTDLVKQDKIAEIQGLEQRIQTFNQNAQNALQKKEQELLEPILVKARTAIENVAKEGEFTYIFDSSMGSILYANESENVMSLVKNKLGL